MGWNGSGAVTLLYDWTARRDAGPPTNVIGADEFDEQQLDIAAAIEQTLNRNGENAIAANISWGGFRLTTLGDPTSSGDAVNASTVAENAVQFAGTTGGAANAYTVTNSFLVARVTGTRLLCIANHSNTGAATLDLNSGGAVAIVRPDGSSALTGGELVSGEIFEVVWDGVSWVLIHSAATEEGNFPDGSVTVGINDSVAGTISLYGNATTQGGSVWLYNPADEDTTYEYYYVDSSATGTFRIGREGQGSDLNIDQTGIVSLARQAGQVELGQDDSVPGRLIVYGGGVAEPGGRIDIYNAIDHDTTVGYWRIEASDADGMFRIRRDASSTDFRIDVDGDVYIAQTTGSVLVGSGDSVPGVVNAAGGGAGETGGAFRLFTSADHDTTIDWWQFYLTSTDDVLRVQTSTGIVGWAINNQGDVTLANATGEVNIGINDSVRGLLQVFGGGTTETGGVFRIYNSFDDDGTVDYYYFSCGEGTSDGHLRIGRNSGGSSDIILRTDGRTDLARTSGDVRIGTDDSQLALLTLYGGAGTAGGDLRIHTGATATGGINYWTLSPDTDGGLVITSDTGLADPFKVASNGDILMSRAVGNVYVGVTDSVKATLHLNGPATGEGGSARFYNAGDDDTNYEYWEAYVDATDYRIRRNGVNPDFVIFDSGFTSLAINQGGVGLGTEDTVRGYVVLHGSTGSSGGEIRWHQGATADTTVDYFRIIADTGDTIFQNVSPLAAITTVMEIGENDAIKIGSNRGADGKVHIDNNGEFTSTLILQDTTEPTLLFRSDAGNHMRLNWSDTQSRLSIQAANSTGGFLDDLNWFYYDGDVRLSMEGGDTQIGADGATRAFLTLHGGATTADAILRLYNGATNRTPTSYWDIEPNGDEMVFETDNAAQLRIRPLSNSLTLDGDLTKVTLNTSDTADNKVLTLAGAGPDANPRARGAYILLHGNENANTGQLHIAAGNITGGDILFYTNATEQRLSVERSGTVRVSTDGGALAGSLYVHGDNASGAFDVRLYNPDLQDGTTDYWQMTSNAGNFQLSGNNQTVVPFQINTGGLIELKRDASAIVDFINTDNSTTSRDAINFKRGSGAGNSVRLRTDSLGSNDVDALVVSNSGSNEIARFYTKTNSAQGATNNSVSMGCYSGGMVVFDDSGIIQAGRVAHPSNPVASTSGTSVSFGSIPSWATIIWINGRGVSKAGGGSASKIRMQLGDAGGIETTGYEGAAISVDASTPLGSASASSFGFTAGSPILAADTFWVQATLTNCSGNIWHCEASCVVDDGAAVLHTHMGNKTTSATMDRLEINFDSGDAFDAGNWEVYYA